MWKITEIDQEIVQARIEYLLPRYIGPGTNCSFALLVQKTGAHRNTVENWYHGRVMPTFDSIYKLCAILGPEFINDLFAPLGFCGMKWAQGASATALKLNSELTGVAALLAKALEDGHIDDREHAKLQPVFSRLISDLQAFKGGTGES